MINLNEIKVLAWDIGGTVFNWRGTIEGELEKIANQQGATLDTYQFASDWRYGMFEMLAKVRNGDLPRLNADEIHRKMLDIVLEKHVSISLTASERDELNHVWHKLEAWPDAPEAIQRLRTRYTVVPLTVMSWAIGVDCSKYNGISWDGLISCEFLRDYKPDPGSLVTKVCGCPGNLCNSILPPTALKDSENKSARKWSTFSSAPPWIITVGGR